MMKLASSMNIFCRRSICIAAAIARGAIAITFTRSSIANSVSAAESFYASSDEGPLPDLDGAIGWLNSPPLNRKSLRGKVVLVDFWTYTCINSLRPLPYVKSWRTRSPGGNRRSRPGGVGSQTRQGAAEESPPSTSMDNFRNPQ